MITAFIKNQLLTVSHNLIVSDSIDYLTAKFVFQTADWENCDKWAHFKQKEKVYEVNLVNDEITADMHLNLSVGEWELYLHGNKNGQRITTNIAKLVVEKTGVLNGEPLAKVPLSDAEQIALKADNAERIAKDIENRANSGEFKGDTGGLYYPEMHIDENGNLIVEGIVDNSSIDFRINNKDLEVIING